MDAEEIGTAIAVCLECFTHALTQRGHENVLVALADEIGNVVRSVQPSRIRDALQAAQKHLQATEM